MSEDVRVERHGRLGLILLDRPKALNALNLAMAERLDAVLADWAVDESVEAVAIRGLGGRAFCSGGDVRAIGVLPDPAERAALGDRFFRAEYTVNHRIHTFPKPYVALIDGIAMGGGMGLSIHGSHRIVTENSLLAMPETALGLFPDVGASWYLTQCPGRMGRYVGLTGLRLDAADALALGLATHFVPAAVLDALTADLAAADRLGRGEIDRILARHQGQASASALPARQADIDRVFGADSLEAIMAGLAVEPVDWAAEALVAMHRASPTSLAVTFRRLMEAPGQGIAEILRRDYRLARHLVAGPDFAEGVRAILIDKDQAPRWQPAALAELDPGAIDGLLAPLADPAEELTF
jgi:enoyl-CoA hydratase